MKLKEIFLEFNQTGECVLNIDKVCAMDWSTKQGEKSNKICRDAFIQVHMPHDEWALVFVRNFNRQLKAQINKKQALEIISRLDLKPRNSTTFKTFVTFRKNWTLVDKLMSEAGL